MALLGARSKYYFYNTMVCLLKALEGKVITVDLRNNIFIRGKLNWCESTMGLEFSNVTWTDVKGNQRKFDNFYIKGRQIQYVHIPDEVDIVKAMHWQLNKAEYFQSKQRNLQKKSFDRKRMMQEKNRNKFERRERSAGTLQNPPTWRSSERAEQQGSQGNVSYKKFEQFKTPQEKDGSLTERLQNVAASGSCAQTSPERDQSSPHTNIKREGSSLQTQIEKDESSHQSCRERGGGSGSIPKHEQRQANSSQRYQGKEGTSTQRPQKREGHSLPRHQEKAGSSSSQRYLEREGTSLPRRPVKESHSLPRHHQKDDSSFHKSIKKEYRSVESLDCTQKSKSYWDNEDLEREETSLPRRPVKESHSLPRQRKKDDSSFHKSIKKEYRSVESIDGQVCPQKSQSYWDNESKPPSQKSQIYWDHESKPPASREKWDKLQPHTSREKGDKSHHGDLREKLLNRGRGGLPKPQEREGMPVQRKDDRGGQSSQGSDRSDRSQQMVPRTDIKKEQL